MPSPVFKRGDVQIGDWVKYDVGNGKLHITEVQNFYGGGGSDRDSIVTADGYVHFADVLEVRRGESKPPEPEKVTPFRRGRRYGR